MRHFEMKTISAKDLQTRLSAGENIFLVDVRESWERKSFNIGGLHLPLSRINEHMGEVPHNATVVVYCERGIRSVIAIQKMEYVGFRNLINLQGGMKAWKEMLQSNKPTT